MSPPPPSLRLTVEKGPKEGEWVEPPKKKNDSSSSSIRIGRLVRGNSLAIKEDGISSKHLLVDLDPLGRGWVLQDLNSSNGTILNDSPLPPNSPALLAHGDTIKIGAYTVIKVHIGPTTRASPDGGDAPVCSMAAETAPDTRGAGVRTTRSRARADGGAIAKLLEAPVAAESRCIRKARAGCVRVGPEAVSDAAPKRRGRPPKKAPELEVERIEEEEEAAGGADGLEQVSNLGPNGEGGCEEMGDSAPKETDGAASVRKSNLEVVPDLDMPLGEWLDYVERQLLNQIDEETEPIIEGMKLKSKRVAEYVAPGGEALNKSEK